MDHDWMSGLPQAGARRVAVRVSADAVRQVRGGSPWVFDRSITQVSHEGAPGDVAVVFDEKRRFVAVGLWDPASPIRVKVLHAGEQRQVDADLWADRFRAALDLRASLAADRETTAFRVLHGENDRMPGLVADRYDRTLVLKVYAPIWFPHLADVVPAAVTASGAERVVLRLSRVVQRGDCYGLLDGLTLVGEPPDGPIRFRERGLVMEADVVHGHKTGHFLDQRDNRALVRAASEGASVLDVFASTGGFSLSAAAGGARSVHLVDVSEPALRAAERNLALNRHVRAVRECAVRTTVGDAFEVLATLRRQPDRYDVVVLDPPSFAQQRSSVPRALAAYARLTRAGVALVRPGGLLVQASCSSRVTADEFFMTVHEAAARERVILREVRRTGHPLDHPVTFEQGPYLKALFARVEPD